MIHVWAKLYLTLILLAVFGGAYGEEYSSGEQAPLTRLATASTVESESAFKAQPIKSHFKVGLGKNTYPYQYVNDSGEVDGLFVDLWNLWAKKNNYTIEYVPSQWSTSLKNLHEQHIDFHAGVAITEQRKKIFRLGKPFITIHSGLYIHKQLGGIYQVEDIKPYVVGVVADSVHVDALYRLLPDINLRTYPNRNSLYQAALEGEVKAFVGLQRLSSLNPAFDELSKMFPLYKKINYQSFQISYGLNRQAIAIEPQIANGLANISRDEFNRIVNKWLGVGGDSNALVIALPVDRAPYTSISDDGEPIGLLVDVWKKWAEKTKREVVFLTDSSAISIKNLVERKADIHAGFADDSINANLLPHAYHIYSYTNQLYFATQRDDGKQTLTEQSLPTAKIGVLRSEPATEDLSARFPEVEIQLFDTLQQMITASLAGSIDGFLAGRQMTKVQLIKSSQQTQFAALENIQFESKMYVLVRQDNKVLASEIKEGFSLIDNAELNQIEQAWIDASADQHFTNKKTKILLSPEQKRWLLRHPVVRLGALTNWEPVEFVDDNGNLIGVTNDLISIIEKRAQVTIEVHLYDSWSEIVEALQQKQIDMVASMDITSDRLEFAAFTKEYWPQHWAVVTPNQPQSIQSITALKGKRLAVVKGYQLIPYLHQNYPEILLQIVPSHQAGFDAVRDGQVDGFIDGMATIAGQMSESQYRDLRFSLVEDVPPAMERIGVRKDWQPLVEILNQVIDTITDNEKKNILETWFELKVETGFDREKLVRIAIIVFLMFVLILWWNRRLKAEIEARREIELKMKHMATHDELTQLPNRVLLKDRLDSAIALHQRHEEKLALMFIDLDGFKDVNDTYGHDVGDELLVQLAERFKDLFRKSDTVARFGGDEFVVLLTSLSEQQQAAAICENMLKVVSEPFQLSRCEAQVGASVGIAMYPQDGTNTTDLMKVADTLMYQVKGSGKNSYCFTQATKV